MSARPTTARDEATAQPLTITCADGTTLQAQFFPATAPSPGRLPVLIGPATGVPQRYYQRFATWLAEQGHPVLTFDYRGIGQSLQGRLADSRATLTDWGTQDLVAAVEALRQQTGAAQVQLIGHSAGGQMMGVMPNHHRIAGVVGIATSTEIGRAHV